MKLKRILILMLLIILLFSTSVLATSTEVTINGDSIVNVGETKNISVGVSSDIKVGVVSGTIEKEGNIGQINISAKNGWTLTYDSETGIFNIYKAAGANKEDIIDISYKASNSEGQGKIKLKGIKATTIDYEEHNLRDIIKEITIKDKDTESEKATITKIEIAETPNKVLYKEGEKFDKAGMRIEVIYSDGTRKETNNYIYTPNRELKTSDKEITILYAENGIEKTVKQNITVIPKDDENLGNGDKDSSDKNDKDTSGKDDTIIDTDKKGEQNEIVSNVNSQNNKNKDNTTLKNTLPKTGITMIEISLALGLIIIAAIFYIKYKKYNNV